MAEKKVFIKDPVNSCKFITIKQHIEIYNYEVLFWSVKSIRKTMTVIKKKKGNLRIDYSTRVK